MRKIDLLFDEYSQSHQNHTNKNIHWICVPLIFWSILGFVSLVPSPHFYIAFFGMISIASLIAIAFVTFFYLKLSWKISLIMIFLMLLMEFFVYQINIAFGTNSWLIFLAVFIITWIFQFIGHKIEGKKPSFLKDLQFLLIGPIWLLHFILKKIGLQY